MINLRLRCGGSARLVQVTFLCFLDCAPAHGRPPEKMLLDANEGGQEPDVTARDRQ